jgi:hypothetical protein
MIFLVSSISGRQWSVEPVTGKNRPAEDITSWILFFIDCLANIQQQLMQKLETKNEDIAISSRVHIE